MNYLFIIVTLLVMIAAVAAAAAVYFFRRSREAEAKRLEAEAKRLEAQAIVGDWLEVNTMLKASAFETFKELFRAARRW